MLSAFQSQASVQKPAAISSLLVLDFDHECDAADLDRARGAYVHSTPAFMAALLRLIYRHVNPQNI